MTLPHILRRNFLRILAPTLPLLAIVYFAYHGVNGDRGVLAWRQVEQEVAAARLDLAAVRTRRETLEHRVGLLHPQSLDADLLDEVVRHGLGLARPDEIVIFTGPALSDPQQGLAIDPQ